MSRVPGKPKVAYTWRTEGREVIATCRQCAAVFYGRNRAFVYPSTSVHKDQCPSVVRWREWMRERGIHVF